MLYLKSLLDLCNCTQKPLIVCIFLPYSQVNFDCGWIVKGGKYFVFLSYSPDNVDDGNDYSSSEESLPVSKSDSENNPLVSSTFILPLRRNRTNGGPVPLEFSAKQNNDNKVDYNQTSSFYNKPIGDGLDESSSYHRPINSRLRVLAKKTINVKYPTILFEVPTRLETYTTAAPVTFGLTRTICKPKLELPSTVLTLTMCSYAAASENGGPNTANNHFSSNHVNDNDGDGGNSAEEEGLLHPNPLSKPISQIHQIFGGGGGASSGSMSTHKYYESSHNRDRHHRRNNPDHHSSQQQLLSWPAQTQPSLKSTERQNASEPETSHETEERLVCKRDVSSVFQEPLLALQVNKNCLILDKNTEMICTKVLCTMKNTRVVLASHISRFMVKAIKS